MLIDVHCHLDMLKNIPSVIKSSREKNVGIIIANGTDKKSNRKIIELSEKYNEVRPALGVYPDDALKISGKEIEEEIAFIKKQKVFAIGEVGMDFKTNKETKKQEKIFRQFIKAAKELNIPVIVHSRKAEEECIRILEEEKAEKVLMHYFSGKIKLAERIIKNSWYLSVPTAVKNSEHFQNIVKKTPIQNLLCETDSPYSHPDKKFPNTPKNVIESYKKISLIKNLDFKKTEKIIENNFKTLFGKFKNNSFPV